MVRWVIYGMIYLGSALMVLNIIGFVRFARYIRGLKSWSRHNSILYIPIALLVLFLLGYLAIGIFGKPNLIVASVLFGGSIFVFVMYKLLTGVTQRILESEQLEARLMASEESSRTKASFLASVSHEMRTPMNVILGLDALALKEPDLSPTVRERLEKIGQSGRYLLGLINQVLDMNRIESGSLTVQCRPFSLSDALKQVGTIVSALCEEKGLRYQEDLPEDLLGRCTGDETQLKQVLMSILDNAVKYTDAPGTVTFSAERVSGPGEPRQLRFTVRDTGVGIDREFLPRVFDTFTQEDASFSNRFGGSGLSLALARSVTELMGGSITVESEKGRGSAFFLTVPLPELPEEAARAPEPSEAGSLEGRRVLIVEDLPENAEIVQDLLELEGVETDHAENGQAALDLLASTPEGHYDAILMDLRMPVMDGLEATRRIRAMGRSDTGTVPIIALTANAFESDVRNSLEAGMNAHLAKPADADLLYDTLRQLICPISRSERRSAT